MGVWGPLVDRSPRCDCHGFVTTVANNEGSRTLLVALCVDSLSYDRWSDVLRHLLVGLVDNAVRLYLVSADLRIQSLDMGPIQTLLHKPRSRLRPHRHIHQVVEAFSSQPPMIVHALSASSLNDAMVLAEAVDADLVVTASSLSDCKLIAQGSSEKIGCFVGASEPLVSVLTDQLGFSRDRVVLVRPGVHVSGQTACFQKPQRVPTVLCLSPFEAGSGVVDLVEAAALLREQGLEFMLFLLGHGRKESAIRALIRRRNLSSSVTIARPDEGLTHPMQAADIYVRPTSSAHVSAAPLIAMANGMVVVAPSSAVCDYLIDGETAIFCPDADPAGLAEVLTRILADKERARRLAEKSREYVRQHHAVSTMSDATTALYRRLSLSRATIPIKE